MDRIWQDAQKSHPARPQWVRQAGIEAKVEQRSDFLYRSLSLPIMLADWFRIMLAAGANLNESVEARVVSLSHTHGKYPKMLKRNGFASQSEWSKTCEIIAIFLHVTQETRTWMKPTHYP